MYKTITQRMAMIIFAAAVFTSAISAQGINGGNIVPVGFYTGVETTAGTMEQLSGVTYGNTFVLDSYGEWETHHLTVSTDYSVNQLIANNFIATGGSWSLVIYRDNAYAGTLFGTVSGGAVLLTTNSAGDPAKQVNLNLVSTGGLGPMAGKDSKDITGVYQTVTDMRTGETTGSATFSF